MSATHWELITKDIRLKILDLTLQAKAAHAGGALSCVEILVALYLGGVLKHDPTNPMAKTRDRFFLSKGHGSMTYYSVLNKAGFIADDELASYHSNGHYLAIHPQINPRKGIEISGGSLGQGLPFAVGTALALKRKQCNAPHVFVLLGDGECNEGSVWEAATAAAHYRLDNITVIIDKNGLQLDDSTLTVLDMEPFAEKWRAFGFDTVECDGHDVVEVIQRLKEKSDRPRCVIAHTTKGKGVSFMEGNKAWHHNALTQKQYELAVSEIEGVSL